MGYFRSHSMIFEGYIEYNEDNQRNESMLENIHRKAIELFGSQVSDILGPFTNDSHSFFIASDGSKEGWSTSNEGDKNRDKLIKWMNTQLEYVDWVEVQFGDDFGVTRILKHSDM